MHAHARVARGASELARGALRAALEPAVGAGLVEPPLHACGEVGQEAVDGVGRLLLLGVRAGGGGGRPCLAGRRVRVIAVGGASARRSDRGWCSGAGRPGPAGQAGGVAPAPRPAVGRGPARWLAAPAGGSNGDRPLSPAASPPRGRRRADGERRRARRAVPRAASGTAGRGLSGPATAGGGGGRAAGGWAGGASVAGCCRRPPRVYAAERGEQIVVGARPRAWISPVSTMRGVRLTSPLGACGGDVVVGRPRRLAPGQPAGRRPGARRGRRGRPGRAAVRRRLGHRAGAAGVPAGRCRAAARCPAAGSARRGRAARPGRRRASGAGPAAAGEGWGRPASDGAGGHTSRAAWGSSARREGGVGGEEGGGEVDGGGDAVAGGVVEVDVDVVAGGEVAGDVVAEVFGGGDGEAFGAGEAAVGGGDVGVGHAEAGVDDGEGVAVGVLLRPRMSTVWSGGENTRAFSMSSAMRWARSAAAEPMMVAGSTPRTVTRW